ncbi:TorF family putative porin [Pseudomonas sp. NPDC089743]|uniref:TorF family putative porin n=1 Tax=Pseudomonas sp. NPDC089743 TaxID=3364471 RepID=UPI0037FF1BEC
MTRPFLLLSAALLFSTALQAQQIQRELGDFDFKLGTTPSRSMAQGLISPSASGAFHGGLDLSHSSGWYVGQYAPSMGVTPDSTLRLDSYLGYKHHFDSTLGYEVGLIHYSQPNIAGPDSYALYGGISVMGSRIGGAWRDNPDNRTGTLFADFGQLPLFDIDLTVKLAHHRLGTPFTIGDGSQVNAFSDWSLELSRPWLGIDLNLIYSNSDLNGGGCDAYAGINTYCESMVTFKAQRSFF